MGLSYLPLLMGLILASFFITLGVAILTMNKPLMLFLLNNVLKMLAVILILLGLYILNPLL